MNLIVTKIENKNARIINLFRYCMYKINIFLYFPLNIIDGYQILYKKRLLIK